MKAIVRYIDPKKGPGLADIPIPKVTPEHVLVKVMASPINPADELFINGFYGPVAAEPVCCGMEGAGSVLEIGAGVPKEFMNKKVVFFSGFKHSSEQVCAWAKFALLHYQNCFIVDEGMKYEDICGGLINPYTCFAMLDVMKKKGQNALIHTAAASGLGKMLLGLCLKEKMDIVCIVRKKEHVDLLKSMGALYVLDQTDPNFDKELAAVCEKLNVHTCFDAVGGDLTSRIMTAMPKKSTIYIYGALGGEIKSISQGLIIFKSISIEPFTLANGDFYGSYEKTLERFKIINDDFKSGGKIFKTVVAKAYKTTEFKVALEKFKELSGKGKSVFLPNSFP